MSNPSPETTVANIRHAACDVYCGRGTPLGNTFMRPGGNRASAIKKFEEDFLHRVESDCEFRAYVISLRGKKLGCRCKPLPCHLDPVVAWLSRSVR